eukprot:s1248_g12.t1
MCSMAPSMGDEFSLSQFPVLSWMLESLKFAVPAAFCQGPVRCSVLQIFPRRRDVSVQRYPEEAIPGHFQCMNSSAQRGGCNPSSFSFVPPEGA